MSSPKPVHELVGISHKLDPLETLNLPQSAVSTTILASENYLYRSKFGGSWLGQNLSVLFSCVLCQCLSRGISGTVRQHASQYLVEKSSQTPLDIV